MVIGTLAGGRLGDGHHPPHPDTSAPAQRQGVPDYLHVAPWLGAVPASDDLKVGVAAAAFNDGYGDPMVIDAETGTYHQLVLPGWGGGALALSPDGQLLAWEFSDANDGTPKTGNFNSGIRVVDLTTGRTVLDGTWIDPTHQARFARVLSLAWSANSRFVGWEGVATDGSGDAPVRTAAYIGMVDRVDGPAAGRLRNVIVAPSGVDTAVNVVNDSDNNHYPTRPVAVTDDGTLISVAGNKLYGVGRAPQTFTLPSGALIGAIWLRGSQVVAAENPPRGCCLRIRVLPGDRVLRGSGWRGGAGPVTVPEVAGVLNDGRVLLRSAPLGHAVVLVPTTASGRARTLLQVDDGLTTVTLATDLMTADNLTVPGPTPNWPAVPPEPTHHHHLTPFAGAGIGLLLLAGAALWWRRRRSLAHM
ncbi:hypothetical protein [Nocardioides ultimimeridianus]